MESFIGETLNNPGCGHLIRKNGEFIIRVNKPLLGADINTNKSVNEGAYINSYTNNGYYNAYYGIFPWTFGVRHGFIIYVFSGFC